MFAQSRAERSQSTLVVASDERGAQLTLGGLAAKAERLAAGLQSRGLAKGDVVGVQLPAWHEGVVTHAAVSMAGGVILPLVGSFGKAELSYILDQAGAKMVVTPGEWLGRDGSLAADEVFAETALEQHFAIGETGAQSAAPWHEVAGSDASFTPVEIAEDDLAMIIYTSGTTSMPKGVKHSHATLLAELRQHIDEELRPALSPWPPGHVAGCLGFMRYWVFGQHQILMDRWEPHLAAELIEKHRVYMTSGTPFHLGGLLDAADADGRDISSLQSYMAGATTIPPALIDRCAKVGLATFRAYGSTEHPTISSGDLDDPLELRLNTDGHLCEGVEVRIVDDDGVDLPLGEEGEIWSRGPDLFLGYVDASLDDEAFAEGGWFKTGDIGKLDADGNLAITDRKKDVIIRGGETLSSREIEDHVAAMKGVAEVAAVGMADERMGERICAFLRLSGDARIDIADIDAHFRERGVARFKTPEKVVIVDDFPRTASGKVQKNLLRQSLAEGAFD